MSYGFNIVKTGQAISTLYRLAGCEEMSVLKLLKLLYLADRESLARHGRAITGDSVAAMPHGPVLSSTYNFIKTDDNWTGESAEEDYWNEHFRRDDNKILRCLKNAGDDRLTDNERSVLQSTWEKFGSMSPFDLVDYTHTLPEWRNNEVGQSSAPIPFGDILEAVGRKNQSAEIMQARKEDRYFDEIFGT